MALPEEYQREIGKLHYMENLRKDILSHERRIAQLREEIRVAEDEIDLHEGVLELARNRNLIASIGDLYDEPGPDTAFARDPENYCRDAGIQLPRGAELYPVDTDGSTPRMSARLRRGSWDMEVLWDRDAGFSVRPFRPAQASK